MPDQVVRMEGFRTMQPTTVTLTGQNRRRISLLVVPRTTPDSVARAVLRSAADPDTTASVQDILTSNGIFLGQRPTDTRRDPSSTDRRCGPGGTLGSRRRPHPRPGNNY